MRIYLFVTTSAVIALCLSVISALAVDTGVMGGVACPSAEELTKMQKGQYILHAGGGQLTEVPVEKVGLPYDPMGHAQYVNLSMTSDGTLYVMQPSILSKSTDSGKTWSSHAIDPLGERNQGSDNATFKHMQVLNDGTFIRLAWNYGNYDKGATGPARVFKSTDEARSWQKLTEFPIEVPGKYKRRTSHWGISHLPDDTLLWGIDVQDMEFARGGGWGGVCTSGSARLLMYRSTDGGRTWEGPIKVCDWSAEGGIVQLPSGRLLASVRYQRPKLPTDTPEFLKKIGCKPNSYPYKHIFLVDSEDGGRTWTNLRQLMTHFGQCFGRPAALSDGTVVVVHETRYGPGVPCGRAVISHDEGKTWEDESYYMYYGEVCSSHNKSVVLKDDVILTVVSTCEQKHTGKHSDLTAIRWKPVGAEEPAPAR